MSGEVFRRPQRPLEERRQANVFRDPLSGMTQTAVSSEDLVEAIRTNKARTVDLHPGQRLPFGYVAPNRSSLRFRIALSVLGVIALLVTAVVWQDKSQVDASASTLLHPCGHGRLPHGAVLGYIDGTIPVFSNCNDQTITNDFAKYRRVGKTGKAAIMCSVTNSEGVETLTPFGEQLAEEYRAALLAAAPATVSTTSSPTATSVDGDGDGGDDAGHKTTANEEMSPLPEEVMVEEVSPLPPAPNCGIQTGMLWQCVELARRYLFLTRGVMFGSVVGAEDIFALSTVFTVVDDQDGTDLSEQKANAVGWNAKRGGGVLPFDAIPNARPAEDGLVGGRSRDGSNIPQTSPPEVGDLVIWGRQGNMPYGHVAVVVRVDPFVSKEESVFWHENGKKGDGLSEQQPAPTKEQGYDHLFNRNEALALRRREVIQPPRILGGNATDEEEARAAIEAEERRSKPHVKEGYTGREQQERSDKGYNNGPSHLGKIRVETHAQVISDMQRKAAEEERASMIRRYKEGILRASKDDDSIDQVATVYIAEQNYDSLSYEGRDYGRVLALHKEDVRVGGCAYHMVDPDGFIVKGWMRIGRH